MRFKTAQPIGVEARGLPGPPGFTYVGSWTQRSTYAQRSVVLYNKALWHANRGSTGIVPGSNPTYWTLFLPQGVQGEKGDIPTLEWRQTATFLQVRRIGDDAWLNAVELDDIRGDPPVLEWRSSGGYLQVRRVGDATWLNAVALTAIVGPQGPIGLPGPPVRAWSSGMTATVDYPYAYQNKVWRAKTATTADPVAGANWEYLYDTVTGAHNHDDRYPLKTDGELLGDPKRPTAPAAGDNDTSIPNTAWVQGEIASNATADRNYALALIHTATLT